MAWILLIVIIVFIVFYTYDYFSIPKLGDLKTPNNCITQAEIETFGLFKGPDYQIYLPKDWPFVKLSAGNTQGTYTFGINKDDDYEFFSIWSGDYNKDSDALLLDSLKPLSNYTIEKQTTVKTANIAKIKDFVIKYKTDQGQLKQEIFTYTKDNTGYLILMRNKSGNYSSNKATLDKIICSFTPN